MTDDLDQALSDARDLLVRIDETGTFPIDHADQLRRRLARLMHAVERDQIRQAANIERAYQEGATWIG